MHLIRLVYYQPPPTPTPTSLPPKVGAPTDPSQATTQVRNLRICEVCHKPKKEHSHGKRLGSLDACDPRLEPIQLHKTNEPKTDLSNVEVLESEPTFHQVVNQPTNQTATNSKNKIIRKSAAKAAIEEQLSLCYLPCGTESYVPLMPNVLRVFLENGQTRSFKYDQSTTVQDVLENLKDKLAIEKIEHFSLLLEHPQGHRSHKLTLLRPQERLSRVASRPGSQHFRCLFRMTFIATDPLQLLTHDPVAFQYYYQQCVSDVVSGRFAYEMRYEACLRLAALHMQQIAVDTHMCCPGNKISMKSIEKEYGLSTFLPMILLENVKRKEIRKHLQYYLKRDRKRHDSNAINNPTGDPSIGIKIKYVHMLSHMPTFGGRTFLVTLKDTNMEMILQVHPSSGILLRSSNRIIDQEPTQSSLNYPFEAVCSLSVLEHNEILKQLIVKLRPEISQVPCIEVLIDKDDIDDAVLYMQGYHKLYTNEYLRCVWQDDTMQQRTVPPYLGLHSVRPAGWNYPTDSNMNDNKLLAQESADIEKEHLVDLSRGPPPYIPSPEPFEKHITSNHKGPAFVSVGEMGLVTADIHQSETEDVEEMAEDEGGDVFPPDKSAHIDDTMDTKHQITEITRKESDEVLPKTFLKAKDSILIRNKVKTKIPPQINMVENVPQHPQHPSDAAGELSSSESESLSTPSESPIHRPIKFRPSRLAPSIPFPTGQSSTSFGLRSPDTLPCSLMTDADLQNLIASCGLQGQQLEDLLLLFPDNFCTDPEIIDLTIFNPAKPILGALPDPGSPLQPPTPFRDDDPETQFRKVIMERLAEGDVSVIEDSHHSATQSVRLAQQRPGEDKPIGVEDKSGDKYPSIASDPTAFEQFIQSSIIPPPPKLELEQSRRLLKEQNQVKGRLLPIHRNRSNSGGLERLLARKLIADRSLKFVAQPLLSVCNRNRIVTWNHQDYTTSIMSSSQTFPNPRKHSHPGYLQESGIYQGYVDPSEQSDQTTPQITKMIDLGTFNGLESSEYSSEITSVDLKNFVGLEGLASGVASVEIDMNQKTKTDGKEGKGKEERGRPIKAVSCAQFRIRSVDPHAATSPVGSPLKKNGSFKSKLSDYANRTGSTSCKKTPVPLKNKTGSTELTSPCKVVDLSKFTGLESGALDDESNKHTPVQLSSFTGLEKADSAADMTKKVDLASYNGLESSPIGQVWTGHNYSQSSTSAPRRGPLGQYRKSTSDSFTPFLSFVHSDPLSEASDLAGSYGNQSQIMGNGSVPTASAIAPTEQHFDQSISHIRKLVTQLADTINDFPMRSPKRTALQKTKAEMGKAHVLAEAQQFAYSAKMLVRATTQQPGCTGQLLPNMLRATDKASSMQAASRALITDCVDVLFKAQLLGARVSGVLVAFEGMLLAVQQAQGKELGDPNMKKLMLQSTTLAATLTQFIRAVRDA